jgi:hypothetical protein
VDIALVEEFASYGFPGAAFEEDVVGDDDGRLSVDFQESFNVLEKVELLVAGGGPEVLPFVG